jgi:hypothetical protein
MKRRATGYRLDWALSGARTWKLGAIILLLATPAVGRGLEARFDHRDQNGFVAELGFARDSVTEGHGLATTANRPLLRIGYGFDVSGEGDELLLGGSARLGMWNDSRAELLRFALDARYRGYFGTEELKTFFDAGLTAPVSPRFAIGPRVAIGAIYDPDRAGGILALFGFSTGLGRVRLASFELMLGGHFRW